MFVFRGVSSPKLCTQSLNDPACRIEAELRLNINQICTLCATCNVASAYLSNCFDRICGAILLQLFCEGNEHHRSWIYTCCTVIRQRMFGVICEWRL